MNFTNLYNLIESKLSNISKENYAPLLSPNIRRKAIFFFNTYGNGTKDSDKLNWQNHKNFTDEDFKFLDKIIEEDEDGNLYFIQKSKSELKKDTNRKRFNVDKSAEDLFIDKPEENILFHIYPEISNEDWLFVSPLTYEAAVYINSKECGLGGACWCIGWKRDSDSWNNYTGKGDKFVLAFNKKFKTLENIKIENVPFLEAKDENGNSITPNTINKWGIKHRHNDENGINAGSVCTYRELFTKFIFQIEHDNNISVWIQPDEKYPIDYVQSLFGINFGINEDELLNLDFTDFIKLNDPNYKRHMRKLNELREKGYKVNDALTEVVIPNDATEIEDGTFEDCDKLKHIDIPNNVTVIGNRAFRGCVSLENISIPKSVNRIGYYAFYDCENLTNINIPKGINKIDKHVFEGCENLRNIYIPESVTEICEYAFNNCGSLEEINIPDSVHKIGSFAFANCSSLSSVHIPKGVTKIKQESFAYCLKLNNIYIPDSVTEIENDAFYVCENLKNIILPNRLAIIGDRAFSYCSNMENIIIPDNITKIGIDAFRGCKKLYSISIPSNLDIRYSKVPETCKIIRRETYNNITESKMDIFNRVYKEFN